MEDNPLYEILNESWEKYEDIITAIIKTFMRENGISEDIYNKWCANRNGKE
jgi:hypothetical protein